MGKGGLAESGAGVVGDRARISPNGHTEVLVTVGSESAFIDEGIAPLIEALKQRQKIIQDQERELEELRKSM